MKLSLDASLDWPPLQHRHEPMPAIGPTTDPIEQMVEADRADWALMRLVLCSATATLLLALAGTLQV